MKIHAAKKKHDRVGWTQLTISKDKLMTTDS